MGRPGICGFADYEGAVARDVAHEFEGGGLGIKLVDGGGVEIMICGYEICSTLENGYGDSTWSGRKELV